MVKYEVAPGPTPTTVILVIFSLIHTPRAVSAA
jgi:hypothetical protein